MEIRITTVVQLFVEEELLAFMEMPADKTETTKIVYLEGAEQLSEAEIEVFLEACVRLAKKEGVKYQPIGKMNPSEN